MPEKIKKGLGDKAKAVVFKHVTAKAIRDILNGIDEWRNNSVLTAKRRWIFELIQNAADTAIARKNESLTIEIENKKNKFIFRHNAGHFILDEVNAIIYGGSTKPYSIESEYIGRFGTGFLVTHAVCRKVEINGYVKEKENTIYKFKLDINRESDEEEVISKNIDKCFQQLNNAPIFNGEISEYWTEFIYVPSDSLGKAAIKEGLKELQKDLLFLFTFNNISKIIIGGRTYERNMVVDNNIFCTEIDENKVYSLKSEDNLLQIGVLVKKNKVINLKDRPKIFVGMPLIETIDYINLPFLINSLKFEPNEKRSSLSNKATSENIQLLESSFNLYIELLNKILLIEDLEDLYNLIDFQLISDNYVSQNELWKRFNEFIIQNIEYIIENIPIVDTLIGKKEIKDIIFLSDYLYNENIGKTSFNNFFKLVLEIKENIPLKEGLNPWLDIANRLINLDFHNITIYDIKDLKDELVNFIDELDHYPRYDEFTEKFGIENPKEYFRLFFSLINSLFKLEIISKEKFIDNLLPTQTGIIYPLEREDNTLFIDDGIPDEFKDLCEKIDWNIRDDLLDNDFSNFEIVKELMSYNKMNVEEALKIIIDNEEYHINEEDINYKEIIERKSEEMGEMEVEKDISTYELLLDIIEEKKKVAGWIDLFRWCVKNNKLQEGFLIITKSRDDHKVRAIKNLDKEMVFLPFKYFKINHDNYLNIIDENFPPTFEIFEEIFPENKILNEIYFDIENIENFLELLGDYKLCVQQIPIYKRKIKINTKYLRTILCEEIKISQDTHEIESNEEIISVIPFWKSIKNKISKYQQKGQLFLKFILLYLIHADISWEKKIEVKCNTCEIGNHKIIPSKYLAELIVDDWVWYKRKIDEENKEEIISIPPSKESIENLISQDGLRDYIKIKSNKILIFLSIIGFDKLDLNIIKQCIETGKSEKEIKDGYSPFIYKYSPKELENLLEISERHKNLIDLLDKKQLVSKLTELASTNSEVFEEEIEKFIEKVERKEYESQIKSENVKIGRIVEKIVKDIFENKGLRVRTVHKGADLEIWPDEDEGSDSGLIEFIPNNFNETYLIEIKFTSTNRVRLSKAQSEEAREKEDHYFILVVKNNNNLRDKLKKYIDKSTIPKKISNEIINYSSIIENIFNVLGDLPDPTKVEPDLNGYWIKKKLWEDNCNLVEWINEVF